jgi:hypothetical protein
MRPHLDTPAFEWRVCLKYGIGQVERLALLARCIGDGKNARALLPRGLHVE